MDQEKMFKNWHGTTVVSVRKRNEVVIAADGQVTLGDTVMKDNARKVRTLADGNVITGFAGATADAFSLFERLESKLEKYSNNLMRSCVELAKDWRTDRYLRRLEAMMLVADRESSLILSGTGDVLEPKDGLMAIGSGGNFALAAARAMVDLKLKPEEIARKSLEIAAELCIYTNNQINLSSLLSFALTFVLACVLILKSTTKKNEPFFKFGIESISIFFYAILFISSCVI